MLTRGSLEKSLAASLRRDDVLVLSLLGAVVFLSWLYLLSGAGMAMDPAMMSSLSFAQAPMMFNHPAMAWGVGYSAFMFIMWWLMMIAMMLPSAAPVILIYDRMRRGAGRAGVDSAALGSSLLFAAGYLLTWGGFSIVATVLQAAFERLRLIDPMMMWSLSSSFTAALLILAGIYQWTPLKQKCLKNCRSPVDFLSRHWRHGSRGALKMGLHHGAYCLGCCWFLMGLLFAGGVMNLYWIAGLAVFVLVEKILPAGRGFGRIAGVGMTAGGLWLLV